MRRIGELIAALSLFGALALLGCQGGRTEPPVPGPPTETAPPATQSTRQEESESLSEAPRSNASTAVPRSIVASPVPAVADSPIIVGGLTSPDQSMWYAATPTQPLDYLLGRYLYRSLLDPLEGDADLAVQWTMEGSRATFSLPADASWSDGRALRAADVVDLLLQAERLGELPGLQNARVVDEHTLRLDFNGPDCPLLTRGATWPIVELREWPPFRTSSGSTVVDAADDTWLLPVENLEYRLFTDELALRSAWDAGEITAVLEPEQLTSGSLTGSEPSREEGPLLAALLFRLGDPVLGRDTVREALTLALDREALFQQAYGFSPASLLTALLPPDHWAAPVDPLPTDPDEARALLESAGWRDRDGDGVREDRNGDLLQIVLTMPLSRDDRWEALGRGIATQWEAAGAKVDTLYVEPYGLQERLHTARWQVALLSYAVAADPDQSALWTRPAADDLVGRDANITGYHDSTVAELFEQAARVPGCAPDDRAPFYHRAWEQILEDRPIWPLFSLPLDVAYRSDSSVPSSGTD